MGPATNVDGVLQSSFQPPPTRWRATTRSEAEGLVPYWTGCKVLCSGHTPAHGRAKTPWRQAVLCPGGGLSAGHAAAPSFPRHCLRPPLCGRGSPRAWRHIQHFAPHQYALGSVDTAPAIGVAPGVCLVRSTPSRHSHHPWHGGPPTGITRTTSCARSWPRMPWPAPDCRGHRPLAKSCGPATESPHLHPESHRGTDLAARPGCAPALGV